jgi:hypothetical protein
MRDVAMRFDLPKVSLRPTYTRAVAPVGAVAPTMQGQPGTDEHRAEQLRNEAWLDEVYSSDGKKPQAVSPGALIHEIV